MKTSLLLSAAILLLTGTSFIAPSYRVGDYASDFTLKNVKGEYVSLSRMDNTKGYILIFSCNTCPVVKKYEQRMIDLHNEFSGQGYPVIAINSNDGTVSPGDSFEEMKRVAREKNYPFEYLYDETQEIAKEYGATNTPHVFVVSKKNSHLAIEYVGAIDNNADDASSADKHYVRDAVTALIKGYEIPVTLTKAVGCGLKWKKATSSN
jgi:peroxiredoxin